MISPEGCAEINAGLAKMAEEEGVRVLYACEAGSRAWGFPSTDSDYDCGSSMLTPVEWYLSIRTRRNVIERSEVRSRAPRPILPRAHRAHLTWRSCLLRLHTPPQ